MNANWLTTIKGICVTHIWPFVSFKTTSQFALKLGKQRSHQPISFSRTQIFWQRSSIFALRLSVLLSALFLSFGFSICCWSRFVSFWCRVRPFFDTWTEKKWIWFDWALEVIEAVTTWRLSNDFDIQFLVYKYTIVSISISVISFFCLTWMEQQ